jgi:hypothetical protein
MLANLIRKAPFLSYLESPDIELEFRLEKLVGGGLDRLVTGSASKETVFFNRSNESFGVVCGSMVSNGSIDAYYSETIRNFIGIRHQVINPRADGSNRLKTLKRLLNA